MTSFLFFHDWYNVFVKSILKTIKKDEVQTARFIKRKTVKVRHKMAAILSGALAVTQLFAGGLLADPNSSIAPRVPDEAEIIQISNANRAEINIAPLKENTVLNAAAAAKLADMQAKSYWEHVSPDGREPWDFITTEGYDYSFAGENLAKGFVNADTVVTAWMNSASHRANVLNGNFNEVGIASGIVNLDGKPATVTVEMFGKQKLVAAEPAVNTPLVLGAKTEPSVNILGPISDSNIPFFLIWAILFALIVFDGIELRRCGLHKSKKHMFEFRSALLINCLAFILLFINIAVVR